MTGLNAKRPDTKATDKKILALWNKGKSAKEIVELLGLPNTKRVYNVSTRVNEWARRRN